MSDEVKDDEMEGLNIFQKAYKTVPRDSLGRMTNEDFEAELDRYYLFDVAAERKRGIRRLARAAQKPGATAPNGYIQMDIFGGDTSAYYDSQLIADSDGLLIEQDKALYDTKKAQLERHKVNKDNVVKKYQAEEKMVGEFGSWSEKQSKSGRPMVQLTFGNFIRETGYWAPAAKQDVSEKAA